MGTKSNEGKKKDGVRDMLSLKGVKGILHWKIMMTVNGKKYRCHRMRAWEAVGFEGLDGAVWLRHQF